MSQHFVKGQISYADFLTRFIAHNNNVPCTHMIVGLVPSVDNISYFADKYSVDYDDGDGAFEFWHEEINDSQIFIGYLDVKNKKFVLNKKFDLKHLLKDNSRAMAFTIKDPLLDLVSDSSNKKM